MEVVLDSVRSQRFDEQDHAVGSQGLTAAGKRTDRVAEIVQRVEEGDQPISRSGEIGGCRDLEPQPVTQPGLLGCLTRMRHRHGVVVDAKYPRGREMVCHGDGRCAIPAAHVKHRTDVELVPGG